MGRMVGTVSRGVRAPIIRSGDDLAEIVAQSVLSAAQSENFEIYDGTEILYFVPAEKRLAVDWYMASMILHDEAAA